MTVAPVVVMPDMDSNQASVNVKGWFANKNGMVAQSVMDNQADMVTIILSRGRRCWVSVVEHAHINNPINKVIDMALTKARWAPS